MAQATNLSTTARFHNFSHEQLADAIGQTDAILKGAEAEVAALKNELKRRGLASAEGERFVVTSTPQISSRLRAMMRRVGAAMVAVGSITAPSPAIKGDDTPITEEVQS